jgi:predicted metal-dependent HD superfamily phosphohydrolase
MKAIDAVFRTVLTGQGVPQAQVTALWQEVATRYGEARRHYHRLEHIASMLADAEALRH